MCFTQSSGGLVQENLKYGKRVQEKALDEQEFSIPVDVYSAYCTWGLLMISK